MAEPQTEALRRALEAQAALRREADHRARNTLQLVSSLIVLQGRRTADHAAREALRALHRRVAAVSLAQRLVDQGDVGDRVDIAAIVRELAAELAGAAGREDVEVALEVEPLAAPARIGAPIALILAEGLGNALTHAFPEGRGGRVRVQLRREEAGFELCVVDDGVGLADGAGDGFGLALVELLAQQLRARLARTPAQPGLRLAVSVPMDATTQPSGSAAS